MGRACRGSNCWTTELTPDGDKNDSEYARPVTQTAIADTRTPYLPRDRVHARLANVTREAVRSKYVEGTVKPPPHGDPGGRPGGIEGGCKDVLSLLERHNELLSA